MWDCSQQAVGEGDKGDMSGYRLKVPHLVLIEPIRFALFVIDLNGPAMASNTGDTPGLPVQLVGDEEGGGIGQVSLLVIDDQALLAKVMDAMGLAVTVIALLFAFV